MKYYELRDDINSQERWYLGDIVEVEDKWQFTSGNKIDEVRLPAELHMKIYQDGRPMDYTTTEAYGIPIVAERVKNQLAGAKGLQFIPVKIEGRDFGTDFFIMVVTNKLDSVNEELSEFGKFVENDPVRPDLAGHYSWFTNLKIDKEKVDGEDAFRIEKAEYYLIVSERIKEALEDINATGLKFKEV